MILVVNVRFKMLEQIFYSKDFSEYGPGIFFFSLKISFLLYKKSENKRIQGELKSKVTYPTS